MFYEANPDEGEKWQLKLLMLVTCASPFCIDTSSVASLYY